PHDPQSLRRRLAIRSLAMADASILSPLVAKGLCDPKYERRKQAALEVEKYVGFPRFSHSARSVCRARAADCVACIADRAPMPFPVFPSPLLPLPFLSSVPSPPRPPLLSPLKGLSAII